MFDIYGKSMYHLKHEGTHEGKAEGSLYESRATSQRSQCALHRNFKNRAWKVNAHSPLCNQNCQSSTLSSRNIVDSRRFRYLTDTHIATGLRLDSRHDGCVGEGILCQLIPDALSPSLEHSHFPNITLPFSKIKKFTHKKRFLKPGMGEPPPGYRKLDTKVVPCGWRGAIYESGAT